MLAKCRHGVQHFGVCKNRRAPDTPPLQAKRTHTKKGGPSARALEHRRLAANPGPGGLPGVPPF